MFRNPVNQRTLLKSHRSLGRCGASQGSVVALPAILHVSDLTYWAAEVISTLRYHICKCAIVKDASIVVSEILSIKPWRQQQKHRRRRFIWRLPVATRLGRFSALPSERRCHSRFQSLTFQQSSAILEQLDRQWHAAYMKLLIIAASFTSKVTVFLRRLPMIYM